MELSAGSAMNESEGKGFGIAFMGISQVCSSNIEPMVGAPPLPVMALSRGVGRIDSQASRPGNSERTAAPEDRGKEWATIQQAIAGNASAQEQLFARHPRRLYRTVFALLRNKEDAEDALQDGLCKAFTSLRSFEGQSSFSTWLTRIVINSALMARRRKKAHPEASLDEMLDNQPEQLPREVVDTRPDPEKLYAETELNARVEDHVSQLPPALQAAFRLYVINGMSGAGVEQGAGHFAEHIQIANLSGAIEAGMWTVPIARGQRHCPHVEKTWLSKSQGLME